MKDSCRERNLEPGLAGMYSKPRALMTSTIKSEPGRSTVRTATAPRGSTSAGSRGEVAFCGAAARGAATALVPATRLATVPTAAPFRNLRRSCDVSDDVVAGVLGDFFMAVSPPDVALVLGSYHSTSGPSRVGTVLAGG